MGIGIGGGTLLVSLLMTIFGFDFKKAASTSLSTIIPISFVGSVSHFIFLPEIPHLQYYFIILFYIYSHMCVWGNIGGENSSETTEWLVKIGIFTVLTYYQPEDAENI
ncbi:MAG: hypothetical protein JRJ54_14820 [Deltaproteobacteria bacterium]|nr:hypothetical protein [Deltaproteobacteria bacterium]